MRCPSLILSPAALALSWRFINALLSRAFFQPDEYWQSLEIAHAWVFGYGWRSWEWRARPSGERCTRTWETLSALVREGGRGGIRSPLGVIPTAVVYEGLRRLGMDESEEWLIIAPRLMQACLAASADVAVKQLAERVLGPEYSNAALLVSLTSFFNFFTATRTLSNSTEAALTAWALRWWPWGEFGALDEGDKRDEKDGGKGLRPASSSLTIALAFAALATILRPSNAIIWLSLGLQHIYRSAPARRRDILYQALLVGFLACLFSFALDTAFHSTPTFTPLRFLSTNVFHSISLFYGQNSWHFYLSQGLPLLLVTQLPFFLHGVTRTYSREQGAVRNQQALKELGKTAAATLAAYSLLSHKEWRFLHPVLPILHLFVALSLVVLARSSPASSSSTPAILRPLAPLARGTKTSPAHIVILLVSLLPAGYLTAFHTKGQNDVVRWVRDEMRAQRARGGGRNENEGGGEERERVPRVRTVGFVMPCHSTPWQAFMHAPELELARGEGEEGNASGQGGKVWFTGCEPPVLGQPPSLYLDQTDHLYASPARYFLARFPSAVDPSFPPSPVPDPDPYLLRPPSSAALAARRALASRRFDRGWTHAWPSHLVVFGALLEDDGGEHYTTVRELLEGKGYVVEKRFWNGVGGWHEDERRRGGVVVLSWRGGGEGGDGGERSAARRAE
ncbi:hypothetical protein JCM21900_001448 [Sporobolomyces salmonicolor]